MPQLWLQTRAIGLAIVLSTLSAATLSGCGATTHLQSKNLDRNIAVDGSEEDWHGLLGRLEKTDLTVGFVNDDDYLYMTVVARDQRSVSQIMMSGLIVWFSHSDEKHKTLGIRYPIGLAESDMFARGPQGRMDASAFENAFRAGLGEIEIIQGDDARLVSLLSVSEIAARATMEFGTIVYELKMPLVIENDRIGLGARPGAMIAIGLETPEPDRDAVRARMGDRGGRDSFGGGLGSVEGGAGDLRGGQGVGGRGAGGSRMGAERLDKWVKLTLAG